MTAPTKSSATQVGGLLFPLDMFRPTMLAAVLAEGLISRARNILDAKLSLTRHPHTQMVLAQIHGTVLDGSPAAFWRENGDLAVAASQVMAREVILLYADHGARKHEGFLVVRRGQVLAGDDVDAEAIPPGTPADAWPVARLCAQLGIRLEELAQGFAGGPRVELSLMEPQGDDQAMLMNLAGAPNPNDIEEEDSALADAPSPGPGPGSATVPQATPPGKPSTKSLIEDDQKRRLTEKAEEQAQAKRREQAVSQTLKTSEDELGIIVMPRAELGEAELISRFVVPKIHGDLPHGLSPERAHSLQGKRCDVVVPVEFLSEVFVDNVPVNKAMFHEHARELRLGELTVHALEVLAPRVGPGTLLIHGGSRLYVSRKPEQLADHPLIRELLGPA